MYEDGCVCCRTLGRSRGAPKGRRADPAIGIPRGDFWKSGCGRDAHATLGGGWVGGGTPQFPLVTGGYSRCCTFGAGLGKLGKMVEVEEAVGG